MAIALLVEAVNTNEFRKIEIGDVIPHVIADHSDGTSFTKFYRYDRKSVLSEYIFYRCSGYIIPEGKLL